MNDMELVGLLQQWWQKQEELKTLEAIIKAEVLERKQTFTVGSVRASYYKPTEGKADYEAAVRALDLAPDALEEYKESVVNWKAAATGLGVLETAPKTGAAPAKVIVKEI